jgi:hypothetical protein
MQIAGTAQLEDVRYEGHIATARKKVSMDGMRILEAFLIEGWDAEVQDNGAITVKKDGQTHHAKLEGGTIDWGGINSSVVENLVFNATLKEIRQKIDVAKNR